MKILENYISKKQIAFTLAEVLITLLIIGIIASIVIPSVINDIQDAQFKVSFKKAYYTISTAYNSLVQENGGTLVNAYNNVSEFANAFKDKLSYIKYCPVGTASNCIPNLSQYKYLNDTNDTPGHCASGLIYLPYLINNWVSIVLNDGSVITMLDWSKSCNVSDGYVNKGCTINNTAISVDVNGVKAPNILGKDLFVIIPYASTVKPAGIPTNMVPYTLSSPCDYSHTCNTSSSGYGCAAGILSNK